MCAWIHDHFLAFWSSLALGRRKYRKNPLPGHAASHGFVAVFPRFHQLTTYLMYL